MKKNYSLLFFIIFVLSNGSSYSQSINTVTITSLNYCQNEELNINYTISGSFNPGNTFTAELSDASGSFSSPTVIGSIISTSSGIINATLPNLITSSSLYRIRVVSNNPMSTGPDNGSNITITGSTTDPSSFGSNQWNVYCYSIATYTNNVNSFDFSNYQGMYTEPNISFQSTDYWNQSSNPSTASGYTGCTVSNNRHIVQYKREGFPCGYYQINVAGPNGEKGFDDAAKLVIDGTTVWSNGGCCQAINNVWTGILSPTSQIEFVWSDNGGLSYGRLTFESIDYPTVTPDVTICAGSNTTLTASGAGNYDWSTNSTHLLAPLNSASVDCSPSSGTSSSVETYTVNTTDAATGCVLSNTIDVTIDPNPSTAVTPTTGSYCSSGTVDVIATGAASYTYSPMTDVTINSASGHNATLSPSATTTYTITGSNNCATSIATVIVTVTTPPGNPADFGSNTWNVYGYQGNNFNTYRGMYVHNTLDFDTRTVWGNGASPSAASGYIGCSITNNQHSFIYKREGFPCGYYSLDLPNHDDHVNLIIDGVSVFSQNSWFQNNYKSDVWQGYLDQNSTIEYTVREFGGGSNGGLVFNYLFGPNNSANETIWNGNISNDWFDSDNWCNDIPNSNKSALIPEGRANYPIINATGATAQNIEIQNSANFEISGTNQLDVNGSWVNNGTFTQNNSSVVFTGGVTDSISGSSTNTFYNLTLNKSISTNAISLKSNTNVQGVLTLINGIINTENNILILEAASSSAGANNNSHVIGLIRKIGNTGFIFPTGNSSIYRPIEISAPSNITDHFTASYYDQSPDNASPTSFNSTSKEASIHHVSTCEYWILDRTNGSSNVSVSLSWDSNSCGITNLNDLLVCRWDGTQWVNHGNGSATGTNANGTLVSSSAITSFSPFTLGSSTINNPLPIELLDFTAFLNKGIVEINWITASEKYNDYFTIERSSNGLNWESISMINGAGNSTQTISYENFDSQPLIGTSFYRLKQTDFDGSYTYSEIKVIENFTEDQEIIISPNPSNKIINLKGQNLDINNISIFNAIGQNVTTKSVIIESNNNEIIFDIEPLELGIYFIKINDKTIKLLKE